MGKSGWRKLQCEFSAHFLSADWTSWRSGRSQCTLSIHRGSQCRAASVLSAHTLAYRALTSPCRQAPSCWRLPSHKRVHVWFGFFFFPFSSQAFTIPKEKKNNRMNTYSSGKANHNHNLQVKTAFWILPNFACYANEENKIKTESKRKKACTSTLWSEKRCPQHQQCGATDLFVPGKGLCHRCNSSLC